VTPNQIETLLQATKFEVQRWTFEDTPRGRVVREIVVHPGAVLIVPLLSDTRIVMIRQVRHAVGCELLELPAGTLEDGEEPTACALRELEEEAGYAARTITPLCEFYTGPGICTERMHAFVARDLQPTAQRLDPTEDIQATVVDLDRALRMIADGQIVDGKTIAALSTYHLQGGRN